jgi:signal peptidase I
METEEKENFFKEIIKFILLSLVIVVPIRTFIAEPFIVSGSSMLPTFETGNYIIVDELSYRLEEPQRGEVVIFKYPNDPKQYFIKRIIALPNETIEIKNGEIYIKNQKYPEGFQLEEEYIVFRKEDSFNLNLSDDEYFVMGDNRPASSDSRIWGALPRDLIVGRAFIRLLPISEIDILPGDRSK